MPESQTQVFKITIEGSLHDVWHEITKSDEVQGCMFNMRLHTPGLQPGAPIQMRTKNGKYVGVVGKVLEFDPPRRYAHTFRFTQYDDPECTVIYDLKEVAGGVEFTLTIENLPAGTKTAKEMGQGGTMIVNTLKSIVETGKPPFGVRLLYAIFPLMEPFSPAKTKSENWPMSKTG